MTSRLEQVQDLWVQNDDEWESMLDSKQNQLKDLFQRNEQRRREIASLLGDENFSWTTVVERVSNLASFWNNTGEHRSKVENQALEIRRLEADRTRLQDELNAKQNELRNVEAAMEVAVGARSAAEAKLERIRNQLDEARRHQPLGPVGWNILDILNDSGPA